MAKELLVGELLTEPMIDAGERLLRRLRSEPSRFDVVAALWLYFSEAQEWRLVLASPRVDRDGPRGLYTDLLTLLYDQDAHKAIGLALQNITFLSDKDKLVRTLASVNERTRLAGQKLHESFFNGVYVEDAYVYFIEANVKPLRGAEWYL
ncbi:MAG: hypothetical protein M3014_13930 [Chloroflexota bacterium]|nr:hypothetical protein [Chloroflexota bacterium]